MIKKVLCFSNSAYLSLQNEQLVIKLPEVIKNDSLSNSFKKNAERTIPIEDIGVVVLDNKQITITQAVLESLLENNCAVLTCDSHHLPVGLMLPLEGNTIQNERFRDQLSASVPLKKQLWQQTIQAKIRNQAMVLQHVYEEPAENMLAWVQIVKSGDSDNVEGRAAAFYWKNVFTDNPYFLRGRIGEPPNNLLNYGYAIVRAIVARALVCNGLLPTLGIHHHNRYNAYCLADDIMEPYRPYVDLKVIEILQKGIEHTELTKECKQELLSIPMMDVQINGQVSPLMLAVSQTTTSLVKCFNGTSRKLTYPEL